MGQNSGDLMGFATEMNHSDGDGFCNGDGVNSGRGLRWDWWEISLGFKP
jgi:hypothetical protein